MRLPLLTGDFRLLQPDEIADLNIMTVPTDSETGYILEVDLNYPDHLHDEHNDYPCAP